MITEATHVPTIYAALERLAPNAPPDDLQEYARAIVRRAVLHKVARKPAGAKAKTTLASIDKTLQRLATKVSEIKPNSDEHRALIAAARTSPAEILKALSEINSALVKAHDLVTSDLARTKATKKAEAAVDNVSRYFARTVYPALTGKTAGAGRNPNAETHGPFTRALGDILHALELLDSKKSAMHRARVSSNQVKASKKVVFLGST